MYFKILDANNQTLRTIVANNYDDACMIAKELTPLFAFITPITHEEFHQKS